MKINTYIVPDVIQYYCVKNVRLPKINKVNQCCSIYGGNHIYDEFIIIFVKYEKLIDSTLKHERICISYVQFYLHLMVIYF